MGQLTNLFVSESYQGLLKMTNSTTGVTGTLQTVQTGDGTNTPLQISQTQVNISGSFTVNGVPITGGTINTGSFATTGSNTFIGAQIIEGNVTFPSNSFVSTDNVSGALYLSSLNQGTLYLNGDGGEGDVIVGYSAWQNSLKVKGGSTEITGSLGVTNIKGTGSLFLQPNQSDARFVEVYNTSPTDTHITASGGQIFLGDDVTYIKVDNYGSVKRIDIVADNLINVSGSMSVTGSIDITGQYLVNGVAFSGGTSGTSGTSGDSGSSGTSGTSGQDGSSGTSGTSGGTGSSGTSGTSGVAGSSGTSGTDGSSGTSGVSPSLVGVITTGSIVDTQSITGSLILGDTTISGSLIGNTVNGGIIKIQSEGSKSGSVQFNITGSSPISQSNVIFGGTAGPAAVTQTGSVVISGSNNILFNGFRGNTLVTQGTYGYINGQGNIVSTVPTIGTGSVIRPVINNNQLNSLVALQFTTSSLTVPNIGNNLIYSQVTLNHQSGSVSFNLNGTIGGAVTSNQNITTPNTQASISSNLFTGNLTTTLSHNSSSIIYNGNIGAVVVTNNYSSSVSTAVDNINVTTNLFNGNSNTLVVTGSNSGTRRTFNSNFINGRSNLINSDYSGGTGGHLVSTALLGDNLIVSASNTTTTQGGSTFVGRFNATGSLQESSNDAVFVVGTGTAAGSRRNALHIDNNNNIRMTGSVNISGSNHQTIGNVSITGSLNVSGSNNTIKLNGNTSINGVTNVLTVTGSANITHNIAGQPALTLVNSTGAGQPGLNVTGSVSISGQLNTTGNINDLKIHTGSANVNSIGIGTNTLLSSTGSSLNNVAIGDSALRNNVVGANSVAIGNSALQNSTEGFNTAIGGSTLTALITGESNIAIGSSAVQALTGGTKNTAIGFNSMVNVVTGSNNVAIGSGTLQRNISGSGCVVIGNQAGGWSTTSNEFFVGNDSLGSAENERSGSMFYGQFANPISGQNLRINANTKIIGDVQFSSGSNKTIGTFVLDGGNPGVATVSNSLVTANSLIFLTKQTNTNSGHGIVSVTSKGTGTFSVTSDHNGDADTVAYLIINPA